MIRLLLACLAAGSALLAGSGHAQTAACCATQGGVTGACSITGFALCGDGTASACVCGSGTSSPPTLGQLAMPAATSLGSVTLGTTSMPFVAKVTNLGALPVAVSTVSSGAPSEFVVTGHTCSTLTGGGSCSVTVVFKPFIAAFRSTFITIVSNGVGSPQAFLVTGTGFPAAVGGAPPAAGAPTIEVVEYFQDSWDHYFVTALTVEVDKLDAGTFVGWKRTGLKFKAYPNGLPGTSSMCRFFGTAFGERSSHFYTPVASECSTVKANPNWSFEGDVFGVVLPTAAGTCPSGLTPLYRLYNNGQGGAPNHRYTTDIAVRSVMAAFGWIPEGSGSLGVIACTP